MEKRNKPYFIISILLLVAWQFLYWSSYGNHCPIWVLLSIVLLIDLYWITALIIAALRSGDDTPRVRHSFFPSRIFGLLFFVSCFCFEVGAFGLSYFSIGDKFILSDERKPLQTKGDAYYLSLGTMTTVDIVNFSSTDPDAKALKTFQVLSNFLMFFSIFPILLSRLSSFRDKLQSKVLRDYEADINLEFHVANIEKLTGLTPYEWCELSGIHRLNDDFSESLIYKIEGKYPTLELVANEEIKMNFDIKNKQVIINRFSLPSDKKGKIKYLVRNIENSAKNWGFTTIMISVSDNVMDNLDLLEWEKYGFKPLNECADALKKFLASKSSNAKTLLEILNNPELKEEWAATKFNWKIQKTL